MNNVLKDSNGLIITGADTSHVNANYITPEALAQAKKYASTQSSSPVITPDSLNTNPAVLSIPTVSLPNNTSSISTDVSNQITSAKNSADQALKAYQSSTQIKETSAMDKVLSSIGIKTQALSDKASAEQDPAFLAKQRIATDTYNALEKNQQAQRTEIAALGTQNLVGEAATNAENAINHRYALDNANLAVTADIANRNYQSAQSNIDKAAQLKMDAVQPYIELYSKLLDSADANLSDANKAVLQQKQKEFETIQQQEGDKVKQIGQIAITASQNGAPPEIIKAITNSKDLGSALSAAGSYGQDALRQLQITKAKLDIQKVAQDILANQPVSGEYANLINGAGNLVGAAKGKETKNAIAQALANNDYATAYAQIASNVEDSLTGTNKTRFSSARTDIGVMSGLRDAIQAYSDAGGNMGYLKGSADQIARRFGQLKTDPRFAALAVELDREFQTYRNEMTGAVFSPAESAEYAKVNPRSNATLDLNLATIDGALAQLENRVTSTVETRLPGSTKIYQLITPTSNNAPTNTSTNDPLGLF